MSSLLLDSARPSNILIGCPESDFEGVPLLCREVPDIHSAEDAMSIAAKGKLTENEWYVLRVSYSRVLKVKQMLQDRNVTAFVPMMWVWKGVDGKITTGIKPASYETDGAVKPSKRKKVLVPAVGNLCFAYWNRAELADFIVMNGGVSSPVHFYWDRAKNAPMTIPSRAMEDFIRVASAYDQDIVYMETVSEKFHSGQTVRITDGYFKGVTGKVIRLKKSRRVLVELPGLLAVTTAFVEPAYLEVVTADEN